MQQPAALRRGGVRVPDAAEAKCAAGVDQGDDAERRRRTDDAISRPASAGPTMSVRPWIDVSSAFARSSTSPGTRRGSSARMPAALSGLVSENSAVSASSTGALAQPRRSTSARASRQSALAAMSAVIAHTAPARSISAPAIGLIASPGAMRANDSHPASAGEPVCASA